MNQAPQPVTKFRIAIYGVIIEEGKVLMTETSIPSGTIINFPGGGLELGEAPQIALPRELKEETGFEVDVKELLYCSREFHQNEDYPSEQLMHIYYAAHRRDRSAPLPIGGNMDDVLGVRWVTVEEMGALRIAKVDREFIDGFLRGYI